MRIRDRIGNDEGGVIVLVALVLPILLVLTAGGITGFSLYASHREMQRAADQAALAGAAALPPADPNVIAENSPFPLPDTDPVYEVFEDAGLNVPRIGELIPDPRSVACAIGSEALDAESAALVTAFEDQTGFETPLNDDGDPRTTVCDDPRIYPRIEPNPHNTTAVECTNRLVEAVASDVGPLDPDLPALDPLLEPVQGTINSLVDMPLNHVLPAALTPRMHVDVYSHLEPPLLNLVTDSTSGTMKVGATAYRRIKNAVVVPILPAQQRQIELGLVDPIEVMTDPVNLNNALHAQQSKLIAAIDDVDNRLDEQMATYGLPCQHLLHNVRQDLRDIYDPPTGPAPSALDIVDSAVTAAENTAARTGIPTPDPTNPDSLAGEAFYLIGVSVDEFMNPVAATQIPILDAALVVMNEVAEGDYRAAVINAANAYGVFRASLVE